MKNAILDSVCFTRNCTLACIRQTQTEGKGEEVRKHDAALFRREKFILLQVCLTGGH